MPPKRTAKTTTIVTRKSSIPTSPSITVAPPDELALSTPASNDEADTPQAQPYLLRPADTDSTLDIEESEDVEGLERLTWSLEMTEQLVEVLHEVFSEGGSADNSFKLATFEKAALKVRHIYKGPLEITRKRCKNKWQDLKKKWGHWVFLSVQSGFGFNHETELYEAYDYVWDHLNKSKPTIIWHKTHVMPFRDLIGEICHETQATGKNSFTTANPTPIDPQLLALDTTNTSRSISPTPILARKTLYSRSKKRAKTEGEDDEDEGAPVPKKVDMGSALVGLTRELELTRKAKEEFLTKRQRAIQLLEKVYKHRLHIMAFIAGLSFFQNEGNAETFITLTDIDTRDRYLEISLGTELIDQPL